MAFSAVVVEVGAEQRLRRCRELDDRWQVLDKDPKHDEARARRPGLRR